jgi:hypothetical protein
MRTRRVTLLIGFVSFLSCLVSTITINVGHTSAELQSALGNTNQLANASIAPSDPDFSIVLFPDTQFYNGSYNYVFQDQVNWVVTNKAALNIKMVIGLGDIVDGGGYPVDSAGNVVGSCHTAPPSGWQKQWQQAQAAIKILTSHGITYQPTIGNHDYVPGRPPSTERRHQLLLLFWSPQLSADWIHPRLDRKTHAQLLPEHKDWLHNFHDPVPGAVSPELDRR